MRVGEVEDVVVKLIHNRAIFGPITGTSGVLWEPESESAKSGD